jgi:electron transport complex protein RnfB
MDAIVGAAKQMHTVLIAQCTGCALCLPSCPVDCIEMSTLEELSRRGSAEARVYAAVPVAQDATRWRDRYDWHRQRSSQPRDRAQARRVADDETSPAAISGLQAQPDVEQRRAAVQAALARARVRRAPAD